MRRVLYCALVLVAFSSCCSDFTSAKDVATNEHVILKFDTRKVFKAIKRIQHLRGQHKVNEEERLMNVVLVIAGAGVHGGNGGHVPVVPGTIDAMGGLPSGGSGGMAAINAALLLLTLAGLAGGITYLVKK
ncbi:hypothetical protein PPTG_02116 [Phytophthora nicotianae INRA-310]|uniref:RxLR effector protein n=1 Tax=Phytophthora nicotianae (strain INRA-310) TaxID=761204 RepID=W2R9J9_PHYN3|nr:hypothetical protein PPTG_02116 [Phytophthora nicotianae INRA-310]ETN22067.1 hypothetical protein PPTG_02116 [Phytophthora nicotianae INRA-310]